MTLPNSNAFIYIIGNNGSGKSRALEEDAQLKSESADVVVISTSASDKFTYGGVKKLRQKGSYTYAGNRTVGNGLHTNTLSANVVLNFKRLIERKSAENFLNLLPIIGFEPYIGIEYVKKKKKSVVAPFPRSELTKSFIDKSSEVFKDSSKPFSPILKKNKEEYDFSSLSSGEQSMLAICLRLITYIGENTIFYIDEPEISLHTEWQVRWPGILKNLVDKTPGVKVYVATHSPIIISSALNSGAHCYSLVNGEFSIIREKELNVERIIFNEFHTYTPDNKHIYSEFARIISSVVDAMNDGRTGIGIDAKVEVENLKNKVFGATASNVASKEIAQTMMEFEKAVSEIVGSQGGTIG